MKMEKAVPYVGMVSVQVLMAGSLIASKKSILAGMTNYTYLFYSNAFASFFLLPVSFLIHRSRPPLSYSIIFQFSGLGFLGCLVQLIMYESLKYVPASFASAILNLIPGFTFILAIIFRMETFECGSSSSLAKSIGTVVSIAGAIFATLYHGPQLSMNTSNLVEAKLYFPGTNLALGGSLIILGCLVAAIFVLSKAVVVKKYPAELIILFFYCSSVAVISFVLALLMDGEQVSWTLNKWLLRFLPILICQLPSNSRWIPTIDFLLRFLRFSEHDSRITHRKSEREIQEKEVGERERERSDPAQRRGRRSRREREAGGDWSGDRRRRGDCRSVNPLGPPFGPCSVRSSVLGLWLMFVLNYQPSPSGLRSQVQV